MTKISYTLSKNFRKDTMLLLEKIVVMVDDYKKKGYRMTLRQLFYQLVLMTYCQMTKKSTRNSVLSSKMQEWPA
jgi:hypothetical protein